jgi:two-component system, NtrC family, sensor kinase
VELEGAWGRTAAVLRIHDDGPGVGPSERERIFQPFQSGRPVGEGTGLGLHCARALVEQAGGRLTVEDSTMGGACFVVWLPWQAEAPQALAS